MKSLQQNLGKKIQVTVFDVFFGLSNQTQRCLEGRMLNIYQFLWPNPWHPPTEEPFQPWSLYQLSASTWRVEWARHMLAIKRYRSNQTRHQGIKDLILRTMVKIVEKKTRFGDSNVCENAQSAQSMCSIYVRIISSVYFSTLRPLHANASVDLWTFSRHFSVYQRLHSSTYVGPHCSGLFSFS